MFLFINRRCVFADGNIHCVCNFCLTMQGPDMDQLEQALLAYIKLQNQNRGKANKDKMIKEPIEAAMRENEVIEYHNQREEEQSGEEPHAQQQQKRRPGRPKAKKVMGASAEEEEQPPKRRGPGRPPKPKPDSSETSLAVLSSSEIRQQPLSRRIKKRFSKPKRGRGRPRTLRN